MTEHGYSVPVPEGYDEAVIRARLALRGEGFSIVTEMHVGGVAGLEQGERRYLIMSVWNAAVTDRHIGDDLRVADHLPCNVVVAEAGREAMVAAHDPVDTIDTDDPATVRMAEQARDALGRVLRRIAVPA